MASILLFGGVILERTALAAGLIAATIAVGGFLARAQALLGADEPSELPRTTAVGGLLGLVFGVLVIIIDLVVG